MNPTKEKLFHEIKNFRLWAEESPEKRFGEWECDYQEWSEIYDAIPNFLESGRIDNLNTGDLEELLYIISADNECEIIAAKIAEHPKQLIFLARFALNSDLINAKWQLADVLGNVEVHKAEEEQLLFLFANDEDEYVSRRALGALGRIGSSRLVEFVELAWATNHEYQRIMALSALRKVKSPELEKYLALADSDGREYVVKCAERIRSGDWE